MKILLLLLIILQINIIKTLNNNINYSNTKYLLSTGACCLPNTNCLQTDNTTCINNNGI